MTDYSANNKRIAKNTLILYFRMLLTMLVSLYTSRVVLHALGVEDYGIYNVVGGVVGMFSIISASLSAAISRFLTFELGRGDQKKLNEVFCSAVTIQFVLALIIIVLAEIVGVWFLNSKMNIPADRMYAANWVFQLSLLSFAVSLISVPYNASIVAHERMSTFAYMSILDVSFKLAVAYLLMIATMDKLIFYSIAICLVSLFMRAVYGIYCKKHFTECTYHYVFNKQLLREMFGFAGWNFIGSSSYILREEGGNIIINLFCGPAVNAARGIASQVQGTVYGFVSNFMTALNPQITKSYASGDREYMMTLLFRGGRFSFYLLLILSLPIILNAHYVLSLWLKAVPEHADSFAQLTLIFALCDSFQRPLITAQLATGKIRNYQLAVGGTQMLNLPLSYFLLRMGNPPESIFCVAIVISQCCFAIRMYMLRKMIGLSARCFLKKVYLNVWVVAFFSALPAICVSHYQHESLSAFLLNCFVCLISTISSVVYVGCNSNERKMVVEKSQFFIKKTFRM